MSNTAFNSNFVSISGGSNSIQDFRLTLVSDTPVMTSEVLAATTLYLTPYVGNKIALYNDTSWDVVESSQVSISLSTVAADTNYDVFAYNNSGTLTLELLAWTNSGAGTSTRATALAYQDGVLVKSGAPTRRYVGTIRGSALGQCQFSFGGLSINGTEAKIFVWNYNNRISFKAYVGSTTANWTYNPPSNYLYRAAISSNSFRVSFVQGLSEDSFASEYVIAANSGSSVLTIANALGLNSTTSFVSSCIANTAGVVLPLIAKANIVAPVGFNFISALESGLTAGHNYTFYSSDGTGSIYQMGLHFAGMF